jgi:hypothetical protein
LGETERHFTMVKFHIDTFIIYVHLGGKPESYNRWVERAGFADLDGLTDPGTPVYIGIEETDKWEMMIVAFNADPIDRTFFHPELLFLPETKTLFIGGGRKAMTYSLRDRVKLSNRTLAMGFWYWAKHENFIIMVEELEIAVYDYEGNFIWETRAEPPWSYGIENNILTLDIMDTITKYELDTGNPIM